MTRKVLEARLLGNYRRLYVTGFENTRLPHTFNFSTLMQYNFVCECANDLKILHKIIIAFKNKILKF